MSYKLIKDSLSQQVCAALNLGTGVSFVFDPANTDYQAYLAWLAAGNTPLPAEEPTQE